MSFELPALLYPQDALEPVIPAQTISFHYGKHHQAYITNVNKLIAGTEFEKANLTDIVMKGAGGIFNNGAQVWNHTFYWDEFYPGGRGNLSGVLLEAINRDFGSPDVLKQKFNDAAATLFGSGWAWLSVDKQGKLVITQESNAGNPLKSGLKPILTCDVWEHAYYLGFQNRRIDYIQSFWTIVNWDEINRRFLENDIYKLCS